MRKLFLFFLSALLIFSCTQKTDYDVIIHHAIIYHGSGNEPFEADVAINADTIVLIGDLKDKSASNAIIKRQ